MSIECEIEKTFNNELLRIAVVSDDFLLHLRMRLDIVINVLTNIYKAKFGIYQVYATISFQVFKNKLWRKDIVSQSMSRYEG